MLKKLAASLASLVTLGCASPSPEVYRAEQPVLDLAQYFNGTVDGWGMVQDRSGKVLRRFTVRIDAKWEGNVGTLDESFEWSDGERQKRVWTVTRLDANTYTGTAGDVVGTARGEASGNALRWQYVLRVPVGGKTYDVDIDDWMFLVDGKVMLNRSVMTKFGFRVGEITLSFARRN